MTEKRLLREAKLDPLLQEYGVIILDQAHERTVDLDILMGLLKDKQTKKRTDLRLIIMGASLDHQKFMVCKIISALVTGIKNISRVSEANDAFFLYL